MDVGKETQGVPNDCIFVIRQTLVVNMLLTVGIVVPLVLAAVIGAIYFLILCPPREPANIPAVPFWLTLLPLFRDVDQIETYKKYLEPRFREYGAVKIFFGGQWNILVGRPEFVAHLFKDEDLFRKSGNFEKIPHSLFSRFLGSDQQDVGCQDIR